MNLRTSRRASLSRLAAASRRARGPLAVALLFAALPALLYASVTVGGRTLVPYDALVADPLFRGALAGAGIEQPHNELVGDLVFQNIVWKQYVVEALQDGQAPLWNRLVAGGMPFLAAGQHSALYPTILAFLALGPDRAFGWSALVSLWLAAIAMYWLARVLGLGRPASVATGLAWSGSSLFVANSVFPMIQGAMAWAPAILAGIELAALASARADARGWLPRGRGAVAVLAIALATALTALAGHVEMLYYAGLAASAFALYRVLSVAHSAGVGAGARLLVWLLAGALTGVLAAGAQLVPLAELARESWRSGAQSYDTVIGYAYGLRQLLTFVVPDFYGNPAHHRVWDLLSGERVALLGHAMWGTGWGTKNYVEAAAYVGIAVLVLAPIGLAGNRHRGVAWFLAGLAALSLTFAFGLPTYRMLFAGLPGFDQLHTPFRWVFPFALATVILAGMGLDDLVRRDRPSRFAAVVGGATLCAGLALAVLLAFAFGLPRAWIGRVEAVIESAPAARDAVLARFPDMAAFASYEYWNLLHLGAFLCLTGAAVLFLNRGGERPASRRFGVLLAGIAIAADLFLVGFGFHASVDPALANLTPPAVAWLRDATAVKWGRAVGYGSANVLWPNTAMRFGIPDVRAYDSIIPWWTADALDAVEPQLPPEGMLTYNRLGSPQSVEGLGHPLMAALGARYVVTTEVLSEDWLKLVYQDDDARIYENLRARPRAWLVNRAEVVTDRASLRERLGTFDPAKVALLEEEPKQLVWRELAPGRPIFRPAVLIREDTEGRNSLEMEVYGATSGDMLVVSEAWFPGWRAWVTTSGPEGPVEVEVPVYRANGMMRAVPVPQGLSTVRLSYFPLSAKVGIYASFLGLIMMLVIAAYALWERFVRVGSDDHVRLVAVNSAGPMAAALLNKAVDFAFAMLMLRVLGPENAGKYYTAIVVVGFAEIFTNFGLNLLTARDVARRPEDGPAYLTNTSVLRLVLWAAVLPMLAAYIALRAAMGSPLAPDTIAAVGLLALALVPSNLNAALTSIFQARERMVLPAGVTIVSTLLKVSIGALALLAGYGFIGLAGVAIVVNWTTFLVLSVLAARSAIGASTAVSARLMTAMAVASFPLMINHLLQTVFFKIDVLLLDQIEGATVVGWYSSAYKWIDALLIIPAYFTMALFPLLSRRAERDVAGMQRAYDTGLRWLVAVALPIALATTVLAEDLVRLLAGAEYLPHGAIALQIMVWFLPFSFANGLTQYVLIAVERQRWITLSFAVAATFNVVANLIVIPRYSYPGAAVVTILSELVLLAPFRWRLRDLASTPLVVLAWRPALATSAAALLLVALGAVGVPPLLAAPCGLVAFGAVFVVFGGVTTEDRALLSRLLPGGSSQTASGVDPSTTP